jgi:hypothetical protein
MQRIVLSCTACSPQGMALSIHIACPPYNGTARMPAMMAPTTSAEQCGCQQRQHDLSPAEQWYQSPQRLCRTCQSGRTFDKALQSKRHTSQHHHPGPVPVAAEHGICLSVLILPRTDTLQCLVPIASSSATATEHQPHACHYRAAAVQAGAHQWNTMAGPNTRAGLTPPPEKAAPAQHKASLLLCSGASS